MRLLLKRGADPKIATGSDIPVDVSQPARRAPGGINPLMAAAGLGSKEEDTVGRKKTETQSIEAIQVCLEAGVDINAVDGRGQTALYGAALQGYDEVVKFLLAHGAKTRHQGSARLHRARCRRRQGRRLRLRRRLRESAPDHREDPARLEPDVATEARPELSAGPLWSLCLQADPYVIVHLTVIGTVATCCSHASFSSTLFDPWSVSA